MGRNHNTSREDLELLEPFVAERESFRPAKVASRIKEELLMLVPDALNDPKLQALGSMTITDVTCTPDLRNARVMFSMYENETKYKKAEFLLNKAAGFLRREVSENLGIKYTPQLSFHYDKGLAHAQSIHTVMRDHQEIFGSKK